MASVLRVKEDDRRFQRHVPSSGADGEQGYETAALAAHHGGHEVHLRVGQWGLLPQEHPGSAVATEQGRYWGMCSLTCYPNFFQNSWTNLDKTIYNIMLV